MKKCYDCPRLCGVDRSVNIGFCGGGKYARIAKVVEPFIYEEPCLGTVAAVFFGGCNLKCSYCQNKDISRDACGVEYADGAFAALMTGLSEKYPLDLVTPTHYLSAIERAAALCERKPRIIYNTSGYETVEGIERASKFTDVFLTDFKYADNSLGGKFSSAPDYFRHALAAIKKMREIPDEWDEKDGVRILKRGLIVRHLVLPENVKNSLDVLDAIASELGNDTIISIMSQYTPNGVSEPNRKLNRLEYKLVTEHVLKLGFGNGYFQDLESADGKYTPKF